MHHTLPNDDKNKNDNATVLIIRSMRCIMLLRIIRISGKRRRFTLMITIILLILIAIIVIMIMARRRQ